MNIGIVYLIQPAEMFGIGRYKAGMSNSNTLDRCVNGYNKGSRYLCIMECSNPVNVERKIIQEFTQRFKVVSGKEYFEGDGSEMLQLFCKIVLECKKNNDVKEINDVDDGDGDVVHDGVNVDDNVVNIEDDVVDVNGKYICNICNNEFKSEYQYTRHKNKKVPCINEYEVYLTDKIAEMKKKILFKDNCINSSKRICSYCLSEFSTKGNFKVHLFEYCKQRQLTLINLKKYKSELDRITTLKNDSKHKNIQNMNKDEIIKLVYELAKK